MSRIKKRLLFAAMLCFCAASFTVASFSLAGPAQASAAINYNPNKSAPKTVSKATLAKPFLKKGKKASGYKHPAPQKISCQSCHTNPHRSYSVACNSCHGSTKTWAVRHTPSSTCESCHRPIGEYWDSHPQTNCASCHTPKRTWKNATHTLYWHCADCHAYPAGHAAYPHTACQTCHRSTGIDWKFDHSTGIHDCAVCHEKDRPTPTHFTADSIGSDFDCNGCHNTTTWTRPGSHPVTFPCNWCHAPPHTSYVQPAYQSVVDCDVCHRSPAGTDWAFRHPSNSSMPCTECHAAPATSAHPQSNCQACHSPAVPFANASHPAGTDCASCHGNTTVEHHSDIQPACVAMCHPGATDISAYPKHGNCDTCHKSVDPAVVAAIKTHNTSCVACHPDLSHSTDHTVVRTDTCVGCHEGADLYRIHGKLSLSGCTACHNSPDPVVQAAIAAGDKRCSTCHANDDHDIIHHVVRTDDCVTCHVGISLTVLHTSETCASCHSSKTPAVIAAIAAGHTDCASCHALPDHTSIHAVSRTDACVACHTGTNLTTVHSGACASCHSSPNPAVAAAIAGQHNECSACHIFADHSAVHATPRGDTCVTCHAGTNLTTVHTGDCASCHSSADANVVKAIASGNKDCSSCHVSDSHAAVHLTATAAQCPTCHTPPVNHPDGLVCTDCHAAGKGLWTDASHPTPTVACRACHAPPTIHFGTTGSDCVVCHTSSVPFAATADPHVARTDCVTCHATPASHPAGLACAACHTAPGSDPWTAASHPSQTVVCAICHVPPVVHFGTTGTDCAICHSPTVPFSSTIDPHTVGANCVACHATPDNHPANLVCTTCHTGPGSTPWNSATHPDQTVTCFTCHTPPTGHDHGLLCGTCHVAASGSWTFQHPGDSTQCVKCHAAAEISTDHASCVGCHSGHSDVWPGVPNVTSNCLTCHSGTTWTHTNTCYNCHTSAELSSLGLRNQVGQPYHPWTYTIGVVHDSSILSGKCTQCHADNSGAHPTPTANCVSCHTSPAVHFGATGNDCAICHSHAVPFASTVDPHIAGTGCASCHTAPANHPANLTVCTTCHTGPGSLPWTAATHPNQTANCVSCHTPPTPHFGNIGTDCAVCHSPVVPFANTVDPHITRTDCITCHTVPINHPTNLVCTTCHTGPGAIPWTSAVHPTQTAACANCHTAPVPHYGSNCASCHNPATPFADTQNVHVAGSDCAFCHTPPHGGYLPTKCFECHTAPGTAWEPITHPARTDCTTCHALPLNHPVGLTCTQCHVPDASTHWADASHPVAASACESCHTLPGNHPAGLTCTQCHALGTQPFSAAQHPDMASDCRSCHNYLDHPIEGVDCESCHGVNYHNGGGCLDCHNDPEHDSSVMASVTCADCHAVGPDTVPPTSSSNALSSYVSTATITIWTADDRSGGATAHYVFDGGPEQILPSGQFIVAPPVSGSKSHTLEFWAVDASGNVETTHHTSAFTVAKDTTPPVTLAPGLKASYIGIARLRFTATDDATQYGVKATHYRLDGGPDTVGTTVDLPNSTATATHTIEYWSVDFAGNEETHHSASLQTSNDSVPPTTTPVFASHVGPDGTPWITFYRLFLTLNATDIGDSGVAYSYAIVDGIYSTGGASTGSLYTNMANDYTFSEGMHTMDYWSIDAAGNREVTKHMVWGEDWHGPNTTSDYQNTYNGTANVHIGATDAVSGVNRISYRIDSGSYVDAVGSAVTVSIAPPVSGQAYHTIYWTAYDNAGNGGNGSAGFYVKPASADIVPPVGAFSINSGAASTASQTVTLANSATDNNGSGVVQMRFSNDGSSWSTWESYTIYKSWSLTPGNETKTVYAQFKDGAGNISSTVNHSITLATVTDAIAPATVSNFNPAAGATYVNSQVVILTPSDTGGSGLKNTYYKIDGGAYTIGTNFTISGDGLHSYSWYSVDNANNTETAHASNQFRIDTIAPSTAIDAINGKTYTGDQTFHLSATDAGSGPASSWYKLDSGAWTSGNVIVVVGPTSGAVAHTISFYSVDHAGQTETQQSVSFIIAAIASTPSSSISDIPPATSTQDTFAIPSTGETGSSLPTMPLTTQ